MRRTWVKRMKRKGIFSRLIIVTLIIVFLLIVGTAFYMKNTIKPVLSRLEIIPQTEENVTTTETTVINETQIGRASCRERV